MSTEEEHPQVDADREPVFSLESVKIPSMCERCDHRRPRRAMIKRLLGQPMKVKCVCEKCAEVLERQAKEVGKRLRERLGDQGAQIE